MVCRVRAASLDQACKPLAVTAHVWCEVDCTWQQARTVDYQPSRGLIVHAVWCLSLQAPWLPDKLFSAGNAKMMHKAFVDAPMGVKNAAAFSEGDLDWFRASFCQPDAATATLNYYRALVRWQLFGDSDGPVWR